MVEGGADKIFGFSRPTARVHKELRTCCSRDYVGSAMTNLIFLTALACLAAAIAVAASLSCWRMVSQIRSVHSLQSEIVEIDASVRSIILTIRRMEGRQTARMRKGDSTPSGTTDESFLDKEALRRYAVEHGLLTPGQPSRHTFHGNSRDST